MLRLRVPLNSLVRFILVDARDRATSPTAEMQEMEGAKQTG